jgi:glycerol uptake facilitator-like aquaporin
MFSDTFAGIAPGSAPGFIAAQIVGALIGLALVAVLYPDAAGTADDAVVPHDWQKSPTIEHRSPK